MGIRIYKEPRLEKPDLICGWPGIGNIGIIAVDTLRRVLRAEKFGEIEPWDFFDPRKVVIKNGLLRDLEFPSNRFYFQRTKNRDLIFFIGDEQPRERGEFYARGEKAYQMANLVLEEIPPEIRERIEQRKFAAPKPEAVSDEDVKWIREHIDELFKKGGEGGERPV